MSRYELANISKQIRRTIINMAHMAKSPHVGSSLSCVEILTVLYFDIMKLDPWNERDIFILSKGHAAMCLYGTLSLRGIIDKRLLDGYYQNDGTLPAHLDRFTIKGVEVSSGSLGHGFNIGIGMAYGFKKLNEKRKVYALIGDGESQEGSIWEGALFAPKLGVDNFTAIIDYNNLQGYGRPCEICAYEPIRTKWESFGWHAIEVDGHDIKALHTAFCQDSEGKPKIIIAHTIKGKGVSFMENCLGWHYFIISDKNKEDALKELT
ncbi:MAG: transketolase [Nitrospirae bacterium]|nr:transketolase [Nitrospirota bacterium]